MYTLPICYACDRVFICLPNEIDTTSVVFKSGSLLNLANKHSFISDLVLGRDIS